VATVVFHAGHNKHRCFNKNDRVGGAEHFYLQNQNKTISFDADCSSDMRSSTIETAFDMRILIIEDEKDIIIFLKKSLSEESHAVDIAKDGLAGKAMASEGTYDLIILDIMLPKKDGLSVLRSLRASGIQTPVLLLTARGEVHDRVAGLDAGADDYLVKPFAVAELRARIRALLRRHSPEKSPLLCAGELSLNTSSHQAAVNDRIIDLTSREFAILEYLLHNKNRLVSKGMIAEHVWDFHFNSDLNLIEVYIRRLRQKIERHCEQKLIHTVRNGGYMIRDPQK
jgi:DNA-binding response OmpR family regulator